MIKRTRRTPRSADSPTGRDAPIRPEPAASTGRDAPTRPESTAPTTGRDAPARPESAAPTTGPSAQLSAELVAELNGRPADLGGAPPDPDSETAWMADGNCRLHPPSTFFPSDGVGVDRARKICRDCPVATLCLEYALEHRIDHGVWGGCSERERRRILKRRREEIAAAR